MSCKTNFSAFSHKNLSVLFKRRSRFPIFDTVICIVIAWFVVIFDINTTSDISKLFYVISRAIRRVKFETILKYHVQILLLFVYTTTRKRFVIFTCRYFKLSWNTTALSQSDCRNFSCSSINSETGCSFACHFVILSRNVGILIRSLLQASCDSNFNFHGQPVALNAKKSQCWINFSTPL